MSKPERDYTIFIDDILNCIGKIEKYTRDLSFQAFSKNEMAVDAVIRNLEIIGEAVKKMPEEIKNKYPAIEWKEAAGFRDVLIHDYFGIDLESVWDTLYNNIPEFQKQIAEVLKSERHFKD